MDKKKRNRKPAQAISGEPCRDLLSAILYRALRDIELGHYAVTAHRFLHSAKAREYAELLDIPIAPLTNKADRLMSEYNKNKRGG